MLRRKTPRLALRGMIMAWSGVLAAVLLVLSVAVPASASAVSVPRSSGTGAAPAGSPSTGTVPTGNVPTRRACGTPAKPGQAACLVLVRTDKAGNEGTLASGAVPPGYGPADLQAAYQLPSASAGAGATVAIVDAYDDPTAASDLAVYRQKYGLPACTTANGCFRKVSQRGGTDYPTRDPHWSEEISLDLDTVSAICPQCHILLVEGDEATVASLGAAENEAVALGAKYVSNSYSAVEGTPDTQWDSQYYNHPGVVITASTGDGGYGTGFPAASPYVVAVGGTSLVREPSVPRGWSETAWSGAGSGCSTVEPKPAWQTDTGCANRSLADVSAVADPSTGVAVYDTFERDGWSVFGGTSVSSPLIAATYALAGSPVGGSYPASYLYQHPSALNDVTSGTNTTNGCTPTYLCTAGPGYDGPTGLGTPDGVAAFQAGPHGTVSGQVTNAATGAPIAGVSVTIGGAATVTDRTGKYQTTALAGSYTVTASEYGYASSSVPGVTVTGGGTTRQNLTLRKLPTATVSGTVTDASGQGWPLYAEVQVPGTPVVAYTSPATGRYQLTLPVTGSPYKLHASAVYPGYQANDTSVTVPAAGSHQDIGLPIDTLACDAPGYQPSYSGYTQTFDSGTTPAGWTTSGVWRFDNPNHRPNYTGGSGGFAFFDVTNATTHLAGSLFSPVFDLSKDATPVLEFKQDLPAPTVSTNVWLSTDGGQHWRDAVYAPYYSSQPSAPGPNTQIIPLPQAAGQSSVQIQFQSYDATWEVDDFFIGERTCQPVPGGLVTGQVRDANTGQPVDGATVTGAGQATTSQPEPNDPGVSGGLYWLFAGSTGAQALTASAGGYHSATVNATVTSHAVTSANVTLTAGQLAVSSTRVTGSASIGTATTTTVTVRNTGTAPATFNLNAQQGPFTLAGQTQPSTALPSGVKPATSAPYATGHFSTRLMAGRKVAATNAPAARAAATSASVGTAPSAGSVAGPASAQWATIAHLPEAVYDNATATDPATGDVYSVGGVDVYGETIARVYEYRPSTGTWSQLPDMQYTREGPAAAVIGGKLYVASGFDAADNVMQSALEIYDPRTGQWSTGAPIPTPGYGSATAVLGGKMYVIGGCVANGVCTSSGVQVYDPGTDTWSAAASYPLEISFLGCGAISGKLYCAGGYDYNAGGGTSTAYEYDPAANAWSPIASLPAETWGGASAAANGQLLVSGGVSRFDSAIIGQGYAYDPAANAWAPLPGNGPLTYRSGSACGFYQVGGVDANGNVVATGSQLPGYGECDGGAGVPWLTASPGQATLAPGQSATITVTLNAADPSVTQPGTYTATLRVHGNTPYSPAQVAVALAASPPKSWGEITGTVTGKACDGSTAPVAGATVEIDSAASGWTLTSDANGRYGIWLDSSDNPLTVLVTAPGWLAQAQAATIVRGKASTLNITLTQAGC